MDDKTAFSDIARIFAHDVNNHLAVVEGFFDLAMMERKGFSDTIKEGMPLARQSAADLESLVSDFAGIIMMEEKRLVINREKTDIAAILSDIVKKNARSAAKEARVKLAWSSSGPLFCDVDKRLFSKAFGNLVLAAIKGTPEGGRVDVSAGRAADGIKITVTDTGEPVPAEYSEKIFKKESLEEISKTKLKNRAGLRLIFSAMAIAALGGSVRVESAGKDKKNVCVVTLPVS